MDIQPDPDVSLDTAIAYHEAGQTDFAAAAYRAILDRDPNDPDALNLLGLIVQNQGQHAEAITLISRALAMDPDFPEALTNLARAKRAMGEPEAAAKLAARAASLDPALAEAHFQHGRALLDLERDAEAAAALKQAADLDPSSADAREGLGNALMRLHNHADALAAFDATLAINPHRVEALVNASASLLKLDRAPQALEYQRLAASLAPEDPVPHASVAATLRHMGDIAGSVAWCERALTLAPDYHDALVLLGSNFISLGQFDRAEIHFRQALALMPDSAVARGGLASIGGIVADSADIHQLSATLHDNTARDQDRISAGFALGSILDRTGRYDEAFQAFAVANERVRAVRLAEGRFFDLTALRRHVAWAKSTFTAALFARTTGWGNPSERPVFVVGMPRSGTTLVEQIASRHPRVFGAGERKNLPALLNTLDAGPSHLSPAKWDRTTIATVTDTFLKELSNLDSDAARVIDKLPDNVQLLGQIAVLYPNARIILCRRDLRDVGLSCFFQYFGDGTDWSFDLATCAARARQIEELVQHWRSVLPMSVHEVNYEELVGDLEGESRRLIEFLGLDWDPACLDFHKADRLVLTASHWQVRQPLYNSSVGKWRHYKAHLGPLLEGLRGLVPYEDGQGSDDPFQTGVAHHKAGRLDEAGAIYRAILQDTPDHAPTLHLAGALALSQGDPATALTLLTRATPHPLRRPIGVRRSRARLPRHPRTGACKAGGGARRGPGAARSGWLFLSRCQLTRP